ncbi:hypothetical protein [Vagococcus penaei]|uniref:hypothetical protein n=1 Tax=Vagococcus penaei TaxID=633807 RepID=UPI0013731212|nr:hypothetical protein [Vagococcus penaei]
MGKKTKNSVVKKIITSGVALAVVKKVFDNQDKILALLGDKSKDKDKSKQK